MVQNMWRCPLLDARIIIRKSGNQVTGLFSPQHHSRRTIMSTIKAEDILGVHVDGRLFCESCAPEGTFDEAELEQLLTRDMVEGDPDNWHYCDECNKRIN